MNRVYPNRIDWENEPSTNTPINETNLNKIDYAVYEIDGRVVTFDLTKANQSDLLQTVKGVTYDTETGIFTFTFWNGSTVTADLNIEKIPVSFRLTEQGVLIMTTADGTEYRCDIAALIKIYTFADSTEIDFTTTTDASGNKTITAQIKAGSITGDKLQPNYLADCVAAKNDAETAESNAQGYAINADADALISEGWANGKQNGVPVTEGSPYYHNNAEYWKNQANPTRLASLTDVDFGMLKDDEIIVYDATSQKWKNEVGVSADLKNNTTGQFNTKTGGKFESCVIAFEPKQSGSGEPSPSNVRPITGHTAVEVWNHGKNLCNNSTNIVGYYDGYGTYVSSNDHRTSALIEVEPNTTYIGSLFDTSNNSRVGNLVYTEWDENQNIIRQITDETVTTGNTTKYLRVRNYNAQSTQVKTDHYAYQLEEGSRATTYEPYQGQDVTVNLSGTYYGGSLDVVSGVLTVDKKYKYVDGSDTSFLSIASGQLQIAIDNDSITNTDSYHSTGKLICNRFVETYNNSSSQEGIYFRANGSHNLLVRGNNYTSETTLSDWVTWLSSNPLQIVYELATPLTIQLTPQQINTLIGENHLDVPMTGQSLTSAVYRELFAWDDVNDVVKAVDDKNADVSAIGTDESGRTTASRSYTQGEHFYKDGKFCTAKTAIASGATFTLNTNYVEGDVASELLTWHRVTQDFTPSALNVWDTLDVVVSGISLNKVKNISVYTSSSLVLACLGTIGTDHVYVRTLQTVGNISERTLYIDYLT